ncbi:MAG: radical SAM protein [Bacteroidales bacterium]|nr:radical SAM protein [Bacteroidales bacterium]
MATFLFDKIIFGPVKSRRLGDSLGINLLPINKKVCNFNCIYCECGLTQSYLPSGSKMPTRQEIKNKLELRLIKMKNEQNPPDTITFAGNGEPTLHPDFVEIINDTLFLRNTILPSAKIAVLSNATRIHVSKIFNALNLVDLNILKIDSVIKETQTLINCPLSDYNLTSVIKNLKMFNGNLIIQTLFFNGLYKGKTVDNTTTEELEAWLNVIREINPKMVMIYTIARDTPFDTLNKISFNVLEQIAKKVTNLGIPVQISD